MSAWWERKDMPSAEERLAYLEGRVGEQATVLADMRSEVHELRTETNAQFTSLRTAMDARFVAMDGKMTWLIGIQVGMLLMFAGAALSMLLK
jgi:uncharacterized coiled-coil protein SlyX